MLVGKTILIGLCLIAAVAVVPIAGSFAAGHEDEYILLLDGSAPSNHRETFVRSLNTDTSRVMRRFAIGKNFVAVHVKLDPAHINELSVHPMVKAMERNGAVRISTSAADDVCTKQTQATWGIDRVTERQIVLDGVFPHSPSWGQNVVAYIVDTGIYVEHNDFGGRAQWGGNFVDEVNTDCNGHGTHVAGTVGSNTFGISRDATLVAVKVLDCEGSGSYDAVVGGIEWMVSDYKQRKTAAVANMSLGGPKSAVLDAAIRESVAAGITFAVAAGNDNQNACNYSPANVAEAITVGATSVVDQASVEKDARSQFSNYGSCVDIMAPGSMITSTWIGGPNAVKTISGTSMATPHVCGVVAAYLSKNPTATPAQVNDYLIASSTANTIDMGCSSSACRKTPNKLLYWNCLDN